MLSQQSFANRTVMIAGLAAMLGAGARVQGQPDNMTWTSRDIGGVNHRVFHSMAFDEARQETVLFGGYAGGPVTNDQSDTWTWDGSTWTERATTGPAGRIRATMVYDSFREVVVLFGGYGGPFSLRDTWEWDGAVWAQRASTGPSNREASSGAFDENRGVFVLFGGLAGGSYVGDTWEWNGTTWTRVSTTGPSRRELAAMTYDRGRGVCVLFGGDRALDTYHDTWEWDGSTWALRGVDGPSARTAASMAYDARRGVTVLFGGVLGDTTLETDETWEWDGTAWTQQFLAPKPAPNNFFAMAYDSSRSVCTIAGGATVAGYFDRTWEYGADCNNNNKIDPLDVIAGLGVDCDVNGRLDQCDEDLNENGAVDACEGACCIGRVCGLGDEATCAYVCDAAALLTPGFSGCWGDVDGSGTVEPADRGIVSANVGQTDPHLLCLYDLDGNGLINAGDRGIVSANMDKACMPLPDYQNGSGLLRGAPDHRFAVMFHGVGTSCGDVVCP